MSSFEILTLVFSGCSALAAIVSVIKSFVNGQNIRNLKMEVQLLTENIAQMQLLQNNIQIGIDDLKIKQVVEDRIAPILGELEKTVRLGERLAVTESALNDMRSRIDKVAIFMRELESNKSSVYLFDGTAHRLKTKAVLKPECFITQGF